MTTKKKIASSATGKGKREKAYGASQMSTLKGLEAVRVRPGMYIGNTGLGGLHHLIHELVDNSVDEAMAGHCRRVTVRLFPDGRCMVQDDGRGIPVDVHPTEKITGVEMALGVLHSGGKFGTGTYQVSGGLHGVGAAVVNALSETLVARVTRGGKVYEISYAKGVKKGPLRPTGSGAKSGTAITFLPDPTIFPDCTFDAERIATRLEEVSYLVPGLEMVLEDTRVTPAVTKRFKSPKGLDAWVRNVTGESLVGGRVISVTGQDSAKNLVVDFAVGYTAKDGEDFRSFTNCVRTPDGGTHETGARTAWTRALTWALSEFGTKAQQKMGFKGDDAKEGVVLFLAVRLPEPQFEGQTKGRLGTAWVAGSVQSAIYEGLKLALKSHPRSTRAILERVLEAARLRGAASKARESARAQRNLVDVGVLPGKLSDCTQSDPDRTELILVEGDSAGGSAKQGRFRDFQAILPLRGKILNAERAKRAALAGNEEILSITTALGLRLDDPEKLDNLRYGRIVIMTDADVDGAHIRTLLLAFFLNAFPRLVREERVWVACPPLYRLTKGTTVHYAFDEDERSALMKKQTNWQVTRYKGLGEMSPEELKATAMDPLRRKLLRVTMDDPERAVRAFSVMLGDDVSARRDWLFGGASLA